MNPNNKACILSKNASQFETQYTNAEIVIINFSHLRKAKIEMSIPQTNFAY